MNAVLFVKRITTTGTPTKILEMEDNEEYTVLKFVVSNAPSSVSAKVKIYVVPEGYNPNEVTFFGRMEIDAGSSEGNELLEKFIIPENGALYVEMEEGEGISVFVSGLVRTVD